MRYIQSKTHLKNKRHLEIKLNEARQPTASSTDSHTYQYYFFWNKNVIELYHKDCCLEDIELEKMKHKKKITFL